MKYFGHSFLLHEFVCYGNEYHTMSHKSLPAFYLICGDKILSYLFFQSLLHAFFLPFKYYLAKCVKNQTIY